MPLTRRCKSVIIVTIVVLIVIVAVVIFLYCLNRKLCDNENEVYHEETSQCHTKDLQGPCRPTLILVADQDGRYGTCNCPYEQYPRAFLYHKNTGHCYFVFSQAFCDDGFWLNVTMEGEPFCEPNRCLSQFEESDAAVDEIVPMKWNKCALLNQPAEDCEKGEVVQFYHNYILPSCKPPKVKGRAIGVPRSNCPLGSHSNIAGTCTLDFEFDF